MQSKHLLPFILATLAIYIFVTKVVYLENYQSFRLGADEGHYYRQALVIKNLGFKGFADLAKDYIKENEQQVFPSPVRVLYLGIAAGTLAIFDNVKAIAYISFSAFILYFLLMFWFLRRHYGSERGMVVSILILVSPLFSGMATRALPDALFTALIVGALLYFIEYELSKNTRYFNLFLIFFTASLFVKETAVLFLPFFVGYFIIDAFRTGKVKWRNLVVTSIVPPALYVLVLWVAFGSFSHLIDVISIAINTNLAEPHTYNLLYHSGPWYQVFIDYMMFSPVTLLLFFISLGWTLSNIKQTSFEEKVFILFGCYLVAIMILLPKNIRYALPIDFVIRTGAALLLLSLARKYFSEIMRKAVLTTGISLIVFTDVFAYNRFFVQDKIYDPIAFNLLRSEMIIPSNKMQPTSKENSPEVNDEVQQLLDESLQYYVKKEFDQCIITANKALEKDSLSAQAWNIICSAYNEQKQWDKAIAAGTKALELDPNFSLARNNLNWALSQKEKR